MSNNKKRSIAAILVLVIVSVAILIFANTMEDKNATENTLTTNSPKSGSELASQTITTTKPSTIASQWQWQETNQQSKNNELDNEANQANSLPFTPQSVHDALQAVKVDENGDIILDHDALISLDEALERIYSRLDSESLLKLQDVIKTALPGKVGEQTAKLVNDYHGFLQAKEEFSQIHQASASANAVQTVTSIEGDQALYSELQALREIHLGQLATQSLFKISDANAEFMFESMKLGLDSSLSAEEIAARRSEIQERHRQLVGNSEN